MSESKGDNFRNNQQIFPYSWPLFWSSIVPFVEWFSSPHVLWNFCGICQVSWWIRETHGEVVERTDGSTWGGGLQNRVRLGVFGLFHSDMLGSTWELLVKSWKPTQLWQKIGFQQTHPKRSLYRKLHPYQTTTDYCSPWLHEKSSSWVQVILFIDEIHMVGADISSLTCQEWFRTRDIPKISGKVGWWDTWNILRHTHSPAFWINLFAFRGSLIFLLKMGISVKPFWTHDSTICTEISGTFIHLYILYIFLKLLLIYTRNTCTW